MVDPQKPYQKRTEGEYITSHSWKTPREIRRLEEFQNRRHTK